MRLRNHPQRGPAVESLLFDLVRNDSDGSVREEAMKGLCDGEGWEKHPEILPLFLEYVANDGSPGVRETAAALLIEHWSGDSRVQSVLWDLAVNEEDMFVHRVAWPAVLKLARQRPGVLEWLQQLTREGNRWVRESAIESLAQLGKESRPSMLALMESARSDSDYYLRNNALTALDQNWPDASEIRVLLMERTQEDSESLVRRTALELLVRHWPCHPDTPNMVQARIRIERSGVIRQIALRLLIQIGEQEQTLKAFCAERAGSDVFWPARREVITAMARKWADSPETHQLIAEAVIHDENCHVRLAAMKELIKHFPVNEERLRLLQDRAVNDEESRIRRAAFQALIEQFPMSKEWLSFLNDRAANDNCRSIQRRANLGIIRYHRYQVRSRAGAKGKMGTLINFFRK
jgi:HEAT repeat protein